MKHVFAFALSALFLLTPAVSQPAFAGPKGEDLAKVLFGAAAIAIIANEVKRNKEKKAHGVTRGHVAPAPVHKRKIKPGHGAGHHARPCLRQRWTAQGWETYRDQRCLRQHGVVTHKPVKPRECLRKRWTETGWETFYGRRCLARHGWNG